MSLKEPNISNAWRLFQTGKEEGFACFFRNYYAPLCFFASRLVKDTTAAEDIVSDSLLKVWEKRHDLEHAPGLKNYCYTTVRHACLRWLDVHQRNAGQKRDWVQAEEVTEACILENIIQTEVIEELYTAIKRLPPQSSMVFTKLYIEGKTVAETAQEMKLAVSTIKSHKKNGIALLRSMISPAALLVFVIAVQGS
ncbi:RNA polymerase sigma-70 factor [Agriterribacter sp.]|uniref:RNA polymerase sigma-70 factor n=1 Tax=Agriterribacter sp. TaxID=2821509 RepID=UPI002BD048FC|nr:RNA polymerase sigma-70 factor [Agriterribacter sp.]HRP56841.1 RNA polymerase sigma-70 factor [Agriterribacter sp.]